MKTGNCAIWSAICTLALLACGRGVLDSAYLSGGGLGGSGGSGSSSSASPSPSPTPLIRTLDASWISLSSLVLYLKFDESSVSHGTVITDSASGLTASLQTSDGVTEKIATGKVGNSISFDGTNDYVTVTDPGAGSAIDAANGTTISVAAWIRPTSLPVAGMQILTKGGTAASNNVNFSFQTGDGMGSSGTKLSFSYYDGSAWQIYSSSSAVLNTGSWYHVAFSVTLGSSGTAILYVNGASVPGSWVSGTGGTSPLQSNEALWVGGADAPAGASVDTPFAGQIDEVSVWKRALSGGEITSIYQRPSL